MTQLAIVSLYVTRTMMLDALDKVVSARGIRFTYENRNADGEMIDAAYWDCERGEPGCGVGAALMLLGVAPAVLMDLDLADHTYPLLNPDGASVMVGDPPFNTLLHSVGVALERSAERAAKEFQNQQDEGTTYGRCWTLAEQASAS